MFSHVTGTILDIENSKITIEIRGIGLALEVFLSPQALGSCILREERSFFLHHHITEVSQTLFGFYNSTERSIFRKLLSVNGVGGKTAQNILGLGTETILQAIELEDDRLLSSVPGIGKKTAQKIIVDLKGSIDFSSLKSNSPQSTVQTPHSSNIQLVSSLVQMGYEKNHVESVVSTIDMTLSLEARTVEAIKQLSK